jgi:tetratricopeptide (TPR) repeat protein
MTNIKRGAQGIAESERALALNPNLASAHALIGLAKVFDGHPEETESHELEALRVSPHDTEANVCAAFIALAKLHLGAYKEALDLYRRSVELNPNYATGRFTLATILVELGRIDEARAEVQTWLALNPGFTIRRYRAGAQSDNPLFLKRRERMIENKTQECRGVNAMQNGIIECRLSPHCCRWGAVSRGDMGCGKSPSQMMPMGSNREGALPPLRHLLHGKATALGAERQETHARRIGEFTHGVGALPRESAD